MDEKRSIVREIRKGKIVEIAERFEARATEQKISLELGLRKEKNVKI